MSVLFMFPGQGSQHAGMLHALPQDTEVARTMDEAGDALDADPFEFDTEQALRSTVSAQLCLAIAGVAMARALIRHDTAPDMVAGLSIGAWPAAVTAGVMDFGAALRLVRLRGQLMQDAYPHGYGMAALVGLDESEVSALVGQVHTAQSPAYIANLNAERQIVVAGSDEALDRIMALARVLGASAATRLRMTVPSHCPLLEAQAAELATAADKTQVHAPRIMYISSTRARALLRADLIAHDLAWNMAKPVLWRDTLRHAFERGARVAVEVPGGGILTRLAHEVFAQNAALDAGAGMDATRARIQRLRRNDPA